MTRSGRPRGLGWLVLAAVVSVLGGLQWLAVATLPISDVLLGRAGVTPGGVPGGVLMMGGAAAGPAPASPLATVPWLALMLAGVALLIAGASALLYLSRRPTPLPWLAALCALLIGLPAALPTRWTGVLQASAATCRSLPCLTPGRGIRVGADGPLSDATLIFDASGQGTLRLRAAELGAYPWCARFDGVAVRVGGIDLGQTSAGGTADGARTCRAAEWQAALPPLDQAMSIDLEIRDALEQVTWIGIRVPASQAVRIRAEGEVLHVEPPRPGLIDATGASYVDEQGHVVARSDRIDQWQHAGASFTRSAMLRRPVTGGTLRLDGLRLRDRMRLRADDDRTLFFQSVWALPPQSLSLNPR